MKPPAKRRLAPATQTQAAEGVLVSFPDDVSPLLPGEGQGEVMTILFSPLPWPSHKQRATQRHDVVATRRRQNKGEKKSSHHLTRTLSWKERGAYGAGHD